MSPFRPVRLVPIAALLLAAGAAHAQNKVGIISLQKAMLDTAELKKAQADMEAKYKPRQEQIDKLTREIEQIKQQLQSMAGKLTPQAEQEMAASGQRKQRELQRITEDLQGDVDRERTEILSRGGQRMQGIITKLAEEKALDVVIDVSNLIYFKPALDVTKDATAAYDKTYPLK